jgi:hypothetical protein
MIEIVRMSVSRVFLFKEQTWFPREIAEALAPHPAGEGAPPPRLETLSRNLHFDLLGSSGFPLGDVQLENPIVKLCVHLLGIRIVR